MLVEEGSQLKPQLGYASALGRSSREGIKEAGPGNGQTATGFDLAGPSFTARHRISNLGMIIGPSNVDYVPTVSNGSHGALIANTAASNSNSSLPKSIDFLDDLLVSLTKNLSSRINVISKQGKSNVFCNQPINISSRTQDERNVGLDTLKMGDTKRPRKDSHILRGKGSKFKVRPNSCESVVEAMSKVVEKTGSNSLIMDSSYGQGALTNLSEGVRLLSLLVFLESIEYFEIDVASFLKTKVSGPKDNEIISKIGLDCSHRIEA
ncbi:hypothetical protein Goklo_023353 [Gossypium klotzschianum]|uniref:Uncharacterized protein n=1 Tax=Gossypium klotzschianum TaxID=34286 RepID=A0A7J8TQD1_9ROSI|nr:hypothetical protein [Gossypium klotzschianum]